MTTSSNTKKITISLPEELVDFTDRRATDLNTSRSKVIGMAIREARLKEEQRLAVEGYRFYAEETSEFAHASEQAVSEAWAQDPAVYDATEDDEESVSDAG